jgi:hypothetical protein
MSNSPTNNDESEKFRALSQALFELRDCLMLLSLDLKDSMFDSYLAELAKKDAILSEHEIPR